MADAFVTKTQWEGLFKVVYNDVLEKLPYENFIAQRDFNFKNTKKVGKNFQFPILTSLEHGYAYGTPNSTLTLPDAVPSAVITATVSPYQGLLKSVMNYEAAAAAAGGPESFKAGTQFLFEQMLFSHRKRKEIGLWYGQTELALVASISTKVITVTTAEWAPAVFAGMEGALVRICDAGGTAWRTNLAGTESIFKITAVNIDSRTVTVEGVTTADAPNAVVATDRIFFKGQADISGGALTHNEAHGVQAILENSGTLWGVPAASYSLWRAAAKAVGTANLSLDNIFEGTGLGAARGMDGDVSLYMNLQTWRKILTNQAALRVYDVKYSKNALENGAMELVFYAQTGQVKLIGSGYIKEGFAFMVQPKKWFRVGSRDIGFQIPGLSGQMFDLDPTYGGIRIQTYDSQAPVTTNVGHNVVFSGILNS